MIRDSICSGYQSHERLSGTKNPLNRTSESLERFSKVAPFNHDLIIKLKSFFSAVHDSATDITRFRSNCMGQFVRVHAYTRIMHIVFAARCYASAALAMHAVSVLRSVRVSVVFVHSVKTNKHIFKIFSSSGSHTILFFPYQTLWQYSDGNPPNWGVECRCVGWVGINRDFDPISGFIACCERCDDQLLSIRLSADTRLSMDTCSGASAINWRWSVQLCITVTVQVCLRHRKPRTSEYAEEKRREDNII